MAEAVYDAIIVGGGPGGLSAAIVAGLRGMNVLLLDGGSFGGLLASLYPQKIVSNYPGFPEGTTAHAIAMNMVEQARSLGVDMRNERALQISTDLSVKTDVRVYKGKSIILATGSRPREVGILGEMEFNTTDRGVYYYVTDLKKFRDKRVLIGGGGDTAIDSALSLLDVASKIFIVHRRDSFRALEHNVKKVLASNLVEAMLESQIEKINGAEHVESVVVRDKEGKSSSIDVEAVILAFGQVPNNEIFKDLGLELDYEGKIVIDEKQKTNLKGIYAAGDIVSGTGSLELIVVAIAQGAIAAHHAYLETATPYWG